MIDESIRLYHLIEEELTWRLRGGALTAMDINRLASQIADEICRQLDRERIQIVRVHAMRRREED